MKRKFADLPKLTISNSEISYFFVIICSSLVFIGFVLMFMFRFLTSISFFILCLLFVALYLIHLCWLMRASKKLPGICKRNIFGFIEPHVGNKANGSKLIFAKICYQIILIAFEENRDVLIDTWLIPKNKMKHRFGEAIEFKEPGLLQKIANIRLGKKYKKNADQKSIRCIIHVSRLTEGQIENLKTKAGRLR
jgi:hypothetical protein